ncbi:hypothetical protein VFPFJ_03981 [Purpureocillium lilacinum]|uniref:Hydrophobin n=2 Tax=Purpureocillium lilacinum TaxID=33203 RepID=A0A179HRR2_PURLI|nr:hypothetical protein VFPFJ_03981 [Purpureocillium lilacinum]KAK4089129.1 hypothetical protein Purlil1_6562 [Purpureocillium lilacinum]OAQ82201.1 hypothetical protein VFPBJ_04785 [Purpureocillium lilacinum]OAQ92241.1 hypothetical protein VFPFJ_03981 [Purpureocillium lilacinum]PWI68997.1 hypothetical protein PCL_01382 [Purpureocillium lilacinum]GJN73529.1 hypothetical protein PLICBS_007609 [Purpureocillium lilacinum]
MQYITAILALAATAFALPGGHGGHQENEAGNVCASKQTVVCSGQGNGGLITLGNVLPGALGENCAAGDVYCCSHDDVQQSGLVNLDVNAQCSLNRVL